jgi:hypothetical protein
MGSLGTVLDRLSGLFSKYFLIGSYFPVLITGAACFFMACAISPVPRAAFDQDVWQKGLLGVAALAGAGMFAFLLSTLNVLLRTRLEDPPLPQGLRDQFLKNEGEKRQTIVAKLRGLTQDLRDLRRGREQWMARVGAAREEGITTPLAGAYRVPPEIVNLFESRRKRELIKASQIEAAVMALCTAFKNHPAETRTAGQIELTAAGEDLDDKANELRELIEEAINHTGLEASKAENILQIDFGTDDLAPTRLGNIALSVQSYFISRYEMNFNFFWTRIQKQMQAEDKFYPVVQAAKAQLDFHVAMFWLSCLFSVVWTVIVALWGYSPLLLVFTAVIVPLLVTRVFYELAVQSYRSYADLLRTTLDLYHFSFLDSLHIALPPSLNDEREVWRALNQVLMSGDYRDLPYKHPSK